MKNFYFWPLSILFIYYFFFFQKWMSLYLEHFETQSRIFQQEKCKDLAHMDVQ